MIVIMVKKRFGIFLRNVHPCGAKVERKYIIVRKVGGLF